MVWRLWYSRVQIWRDVLRMWWWLRSRRRWWYTGGPCRPYTSFSRCCSCCCRKSWRLGCWCISQLGCHWYEDTWTTCWVCDSLRIGWICQFRCRFNRRLALVSKCCLRWYWYAQYTSTRSQWILWSRLRCCFTSKWCKICRFPRQVRHKRCRSIDRVWSNWLRRWIVSRSRCSGQT